MSLNQQQLEFAFSNHLFLTVSARPGSGKTHAEAYRILADQKRGIDHARQIVVTKTVAAAANMRSRLKAMSSEYDIAYGEPFFIGTIHALALSILNTRGDVLGYNGTVDVITEQESRSIMNDMAKRVGAEKSSAWRNAGQMISRRAEDIAAMAHGKLLRSRNQTDFACMLAEATRIMLAWPEGDNFVLYVDEYQDTTDKEAELLRALKPSGAFIIGDEDQAIFGWDCQLDSIYNWTGFKMSFDMNYRCHEGICKAANKTASRFTHYRPEAKPMSWNRPGGVVGVVRTDTDHTSIMRAIELASSHVEDGDSVAILCRHNSLAEQVKILAGSKITGYDIELSSFARPSEIENAHKFIQGYVRSGRMGALNQESIRESRLSNRERRLVEAAVIKSKASRCDVVSALYDPQQSSSSIHIGTIHSFKGREADHVLLVGAENHRFEGSKDNDNEERKIFYVALTRARQSFTAYCANTAYKEGRGDIHACPSVFVREIT